MAPRTLRDRQISLFEAVQTTGNGASIAGAYLQAAHNLKAVFQNLRDYLAGNAAGITRDEILAREVIKILFCKIYDETNRHGESRARFITTLGENPNEIKARIVQLFEQGVKRTYPDIVDADEKIVLDAKSLTFVVRALQDFHLTTTERDVVGDAFEVFIGPTLRGSEGQFFTPKNVVTMMVKALDPCPGETIIDPACGSGGFLVAVLDHVLRKVEIEGQERNWSAETLRDTKRRTASRCVYGIEKDTFLATIARTYLTILSGASISIFCENSLDTPSHWQRRCQDNIHLGTFDMVITNPPFGAKIPVQGKNLLAQYELAHKWERSAPGSAWRRTSSLQPYAPPQVLFIERCLQLAKEGGRIGIVLPEGIFGNPSDRYIWEFLFANAEVTGVFSMPPETFQPSTHTKTSILILRKRKNGSRSYPIFMGIAQKAGHDKNGKVIYKMRSNGSHVLDAEGSKIVDDDTPVITAKFQAFQTGAEFEQDHLGFLLDSRNIHDYVFIPEYYNPEIGRDLQELQASGKHTLCTIGELVERGILAIRRGDEIGSQFYGTGDVPFVRTTDIVNWEIKMDPVKAVSEEIYQQYKSKQDIREGDILFVSDGTFLIGRSAMVTDLDTRVVIQSHIRKIRVLDESLFDRYYLFYLLNSKIVRRQIEAKTFVQATISTLGSRLNEVVLPIHKDAEQMKAISARMREIIDGKKALRQQSLELFNSNL